MSDRGERDRLGLPVADVDLPSCDIVAVEPVDCALPDEDEDEVAAMQEQGIDVAVECAHRYRFDGRDHDVSSSVHPEDVTWWRGLGPGGERVAGPIDRQAVRPALRAR